MLKITIILAGAATVFAATPSPAQGATTARCAAIPAGAADRLFADFNAAWATRDPDTVTKLFAKDAVLLATVSNVPRTDHGAIRDYFTSFLKGAPVGTINSSNVREGCNMLVRMGTWTVGLTNQNSGVRNNVKARYTFIYKVEDGAWKIAHLHSSMMPVSE